MTIKLGRIYLFIITVCTFLWNQQTSFIAQKIAIENSYQQKVEVAVSKLLGQEKFLVIVSIEFSNIGGTLKKTASPQSGSGLPNDPLYYLGLPTAPESKGLSNIQNLGSKKSSGSDFDIGRVEVIIGMDETSLTPSIKPEITSVVEKIIPQTQDCDDCIKIEAMKFQTSLKDQKLLTLEKKIEKLEEDKRQADLTADSIRLENLENQLIDAEKIREAWVTMAKIKELENIKQDSIRFINLVATEKARKEQDSIKFVNTEKRLERVMESKIKSDSVIISEQMSILKHQTTGDKSLLGMQIGEDDSSIMGYILIIFLVISLIVVTFLAANNKKPKTVYLKPKNKKGTKTKKGSDKNKSDSEGDNDTEPASAPLPPRPDEDAMRSEIRSLRQTAVSLTVGEKEGASALIKEWLEDNPNKQDEGETGGE